MYVSNFNYFKQIWVVVRKVLSAAAGGIGAAGLAAYTAGTGGVGLVPLIAAGATGASATVEVTDTASELMDDLVYQWFEEQ